MSKHRAIVSGLTGVTPIEVGGVTHTGPELACLIVVNPDQPCEESSRTPQLIVETGLLLATARYELDRAEIAERVWRHGAIAELTMGPDAVETAKNQGFLGDDAVKPITKAAATSVIHTFPEYAAHCEAIGKAHYAVAVLEQVLAGAKARVHVMYDYARQGGARPPRAAAHPMSAAAPSPSSQTVYDDAPADRPLPEAEADAIALPRTPIPVVTSSGAPPRRMPPRAN